MMGERIHLECGEQIPSAWGKPREAVRKTSVSVREPHGIETFATHWGSLTAVPGVDLIVLDEGEEYPIKKNIFAATYEEVTTERYRKKTRSRLIQVPPGVVAVLATREGEIEVYHPDYIVIGKENEVYANSAAWVAANLEFV